MVTMYMPLRSKNGDHAYFAYQGSPFLTNIKIPTIWSLQIVTMYNPLR